MPTPEEFLDAIRRIIAQAGVGASAADEYARAAPAPRPQQAATPTTFSTIGPTPPAPYMLAPSPEVQPALRARPSLTPTAEDGGRTRTATPPEATDIRQSLVGAATLAPLPGQQAGRGRIAGAASSETTALPRTQAAAATTPTAAAPTTAQTGAVGPTTGYTDAQAREVTRLTVGREMGIDELERWVSAFVQEHGAPPWATGPFTPESNFIDHLIALGESEREVAKGGASYYTKAGRENNVYAQPGITPDFWEPSYYQRYTGPTYAWGPGGAMGMGSRPLMPGESPPGNAPFELAYYGELSPRPYYEYRRAMHPELWPQSGGYESTAPTYPTPPYLPGPIIR